MNRKRIPLLALAVLLLSGCTGDTPPTEPGGGTSPIDPTRTVEVTLGSIVLDNGSLVSDNGTGTGSAVPQSRAAATITTELLPVGETFRLYAFEQGKTEMRDVLVTRAYTIVGGAGKPQLNAGEKPLYLPLGQVDIYLVGPLTADVNKGQRDKNGNALPPQVVNIASEFGVFPTYNADLIASKTELTVVGGAENTFTANALSHKMARVEFCLEAPDVANYENLLLKDVKLYKQAMNGVYVFGADGGAITAATGGTDIQNFTVNEEVKGKKYSTVQYMIPRQRTELKVEVRFSCNLIGIPGVIDKRLSSGILEVPLTAGKQTYFYSQPIIATDIKWRMKVLPWNDVAVADDGNIDGLVFSYCGFNAPETIGGKRCWRDLSGNGNHAELFGTVSHSVNKYILPGTSNNYMKMLKSLGTHQNYTIEFVVKANSTTASTTLFHFASRDNSANDREFTTHYPWTTEGIWFDSPYGNGMGGNVRLNIRNLGSLPVPITSVNQWQITRQANAPGGYIARMNGQVVTSGTATIPLKEMLYNYIGCFANKAGMFGGELYAVRMYNRVLTDAELQYNRTADKQLYNMTN